MTSTIFLRQADSLDEACVIYAPPSPAVNSRILPCEIGSPSTEKNTLLGNGRRQDAGEVGGAEVFPLILDHPVSDVERQQREDGLQLLQPTLRRILHSAQPAFFEQADDVGQACRTRLFDQDFILGVDLVELRFVVLA
jgi:hypothetical protein